MEPYHLRTRKQKPIYMSSDSESERSYENDSSFDPDYTRPQRRRRNAEIEEARVVRRGRPRKRRATGEAQSSQEPSTSSRRNAWNCIEEAAHEIFNEVQPRDGATDNHDDACMICADGGDLICCDRCPSTFHPNCMDMERIPHGDWLCPFCVCKYCDGGDDYLHTCKQCEKKYHLGCFRGRELLDLNSSNTSFCGSSCTEIYEKLKKMVGIRNRIDEEHSWTLIRSTKPGSDLPSSEMHRVLQCNAQITLAWKLMKACFKRNTDRHTRINVVQSVIYNRGSNLARINFSGFYTAILEEGNEIISTASLRIHGPKLAEMSFIATREIYRRQGKSRKLMRAIEFALRELNVENLVIPSIVKLDKMWIEKYQFSYIQDSVRKEILHANTLMFHGTIRLQKNLLVQALEPVVINNKVMEVVEEHNNENQNQLAPDETTARLPLPNLNLEPALLDLNLEPPEDNDI